LRIFEHGDINQPGRALDTESHPPRINVKCDNFNVLELGPGDSLFTAVIARSLGASRTWLVDAVPFVTTHMSGYVELLELLRRRALLCAWNAIRKPFPIFSDNVTSSI
jgi:hypothetical protein